MNANTVNLTIDGKPVSINSDATVLQAARAAGVDIPTMCHDDKNAVTPTACFICVVSVDGGETFVPSCATAVRAGMAVDTASVEVHDCRRRAIELMLSEHAGDCVAPCSRICPCGLDIPEVMRLLVSGDINAAVKTIKCSLPLPATLGYICSAPCQKGCRRALVDRSVSIRKIHRVIAECGIYHAVSTRNENPQIPAKSAHGIDNAMSTHNKDPHPSAKSRNVAIIGSGPAGLSSAYFLADMGYKCTVFESLPQIGGRLRSQFDESTLPKKTLDAEIDYIAQMGVTFITGTNINSIDGIYDDYDAIIVATGVTDPDNNQHPFDLEYDAHGIKICHDTFAASRPKIFACGSAVRPVHLAARSAGQGRAVSIAVDNYLSGNEPARKPFSMSTGHLSTVEIESLAGSIPYMNDKKLPITLSSGNHKTSGSIIDVDGINGINGINHVNNIDIISDSTRCLSCDCGKKDSCRLRDYATQYTAHHLRYATGSRKLYTRQTYASGLVHEPGKCIACGKCVAITAQRNITPGLALTGRGSDVCVSAPLGAPIDKAMGDALADCVAACPTGALWIAETGGHRCG